MRNKTWTSDPTHSQGYDHSNFVMGYLDIVPAVVMIVDDDVRMLNYNRSAGESFGLAPSATLFRRGGEVLNCINSKESPEGCGHGKACHDCVIRNGVKSALSDGKLTRKFSRMTLVEGELKKSLDCIVTVAPVDYESERRAIVVIEDVSEMTELRQLLPVCAWCRKVRDDAGYWESVDRYLSRHLNKDITHGMCPECADKFLQES